MKFPTEGMKVEFVAVRCLTFGGAAALNLQGRSIEGCIPSNPRHQANQVNKVDDRYLY